MKKLIISTYDDIKNPYYGGGGAIAIHEVAKRLAKDFDIKIISWNHSGKINEKIDGVKYQRIGWKFINPKVGMLLYQLMLPQIASKGKFDIWLESFCPPFTTSFLPIFTKKPVIGIVHMLSAGDMARKYNLPIFTLVEKLGLKLYKKLIVTSENYKNKILSNNKEVEIEIIPNGIEKIVNSKVKRIDQILYLGRIEINQKGIDLLIRSFEKVNKKLPKTELVIAGSGIPSELSKLQNIVNSSIAKNKIKIVGKVIGKEKQRLMSESKVMAISSRFETFSISALEAMAHGLPITCFDIDGLKWIANIAIKSKTFSVDSYAKNLIKIISNKRLSSSLSVNGKKYASKLTWKSISTKYLKYLKNV